MSATPHTLVLFDVDGTLVDCGAAAGKAFSAAFEAAFGVSCPVFPPEDVAGLTDTSILREIVRKLNLNDRDLDRRRDLVFKIYARNLARECGLRPARQLPGAGGAARVVRSLPGCVPGLLTGSTEATARIKLESAGIPFSEFACGAYAEDGERREALPPAARARFAQVFGREPKVTILIGDTPRDVEAAIATGCKIIGVTTGHYGRSALEEAGARVILSDLSDAASLRGAIEAVAKEGF